VTWTERVAGLLLQGCILKWKSPLAGGSTRSVLSCSYLPSSAPTPPPHLSSNSLIDEGVCTVFHLFPKPLLLSKQFWVSFRSLLKAACERESEREFEELLHKCYFGEPASESTSLSVGVPVVQGREQKCVCYEGTKESAWNSG